ncbi:TniQ family protein [Celeribacter halophilus]|nr:TniQ family protein [Celeribacter halophilus]
MIFYFTSPSRAKKALNGAAADIQKISGILGTDIDRAMRQTFQRRVGQSVQLGDHLFQDQRLLRGQFRVCPACLRNDIGSDLTDITALNAYARMTWSISCFRVCPQHQLFLVHSPEPGPSHEFNQTWEAWLPETLDGELDQKSNNGALYERHVARVLAGENFPLGWSDAFPLDALGSLCEIMNAAKVFGPGRQIFDCSPIDIALAMDEGFRIFAQGRDAVIALLMDLRTRPGESQWRPQGRYGLVYEWLKRGAGAAPEYEPMKTLLREHILESWPLDTGTDVLGHRLEKRRFHSALSAAHDYGNRPQHVINLMKDAGISGTLNLPEVEQIYAATDVQNVVGAISGAISMSKAQQFLGVTRTQMQTLISAGYLTHSVGGDHARPRFSEEDITQFLERHAGFPVVQEMPWHPRGYDIASAARKYGVSVAVVYEAVLSGELSKTTRASDNLQFSEIRLNIEEADRVFGREYPKGWQTISKVSKELGISVTFLRELAEKGYLDLRGDQDDRTHQGKTVVNSDSLRAFAETYVSRRLLARRNGVQVREVQKRMDAAGIPILEHSVDGTEWIVEQDAISCV